MNRSLSKPKSIHDRLIPERISLNDYQMRMVEVNQTHNDSADLNEQLRRQNSLEKYSYLLKQNIIRNDKTLFNYQKSRYKPYIFEKKKEYISPIRKISKTPYKILDAPKLKDDFYYQLIDWNNHNQIAVGLDNSVYTWNAMTNETTQLLEIEYPTHISSLKWCERNDLLAVGDDFGVVRIFDVVKAKMVASYESHTERVGCLDWNGFSITSGSRDKSILLYDIRGEIPQIQFNGHKQEVCGLQWSPSESMLASGGNDNNVIVNSLKMPQTPQYIFKEHTAAVKALAWSPHQSHTLCSGGGTTDKCLKFWNTGTGTLTNSVDTGSQICNMKWSLNSDELVTSHGFSLNQIAVWRMPKVERIATLFGHTFRVLYMAISPDGENVVTGSGDETLRFWKLFPRKKAKNCSINNSELDQNTLDLR